MTKGAEQHLAKARDYVARGEEFYRKAAEEIIAAMEADPTLGNREIGQWFGKSEFWVRDVVMRVTNASARSERYAVRKEASDRASAKQVLRESTPEQLAELLSTPQIRATVSKAQQIAHENVNERARKVFRESVGDDVADDLEREALLQDAEAELFKARRAVINTLRKVNEASNEIPDAWREEFLRTLDDLDMKVAALRDLLTGISIDDLDRLLAEEV